MIDEIVKLAQYLIRQESVSPHDGELMKFLENYLGDLGFSVEYFNFGETKNLYAKIGAGPYFCFAGHVDVVPPGENWMHDDPYSGVVENGFLYGRGANDMKGTIACALVAFKESLCKNPDLSLAFLITSDEEAAACDGLKRVVPILHERAEPIKAFILGEPASISNVADVVKIGRRGSMTCVAKIFGKQGHIAYPEHADNPIPKAIKIASDLDSLDFADYNEIFGASKLQLTNLDAFNHAMNVIPGVCELRFGVRFNPAQNETSIRSAVEKIFAKYGQKYELNWLFHGNPFVCEDEKIIEWVKKSVEDAVGYVPSCDGRGATSDGRFLYVIAPSIEIGLQESMAHQVNECAAVSDLQKVAEIYCKLIENM